MQHITVHTMTHRQKGLDEVHARFLSLLAHLLRPDASLDLTNVSLMKQYHAQTTLTDTQSLLFWMEGVQEVSLALGHDEPVSVGCPLYNEASAIRG